MNSRSNPKPKPAPVRRCQPWLGTYVEITAQAADEATQERAISAAFAAVARVHWLMSFHDPASEVSRLNQRATQAPVTVDAWTYEVLGVAQQLHELSGGVFDMAVAPRLITWGFLPSTSAALRRPGTTADVELLPHHQVFFRRPLTLDLGGLAKGFAVDRAVEALQAAGATAGGVNAGGDLRVFGSAAQPLHVRHPRDPAQTLSTVEISNEAAATSAAYFARRRCAGRWVSPILDPLSGRPWLGRASVTVIAPNCLMADALTKIVALAPERAPEILHRHGARALIVADTKSSPMRPAPRTISPCTSAA